MNHNIIMYFVFNYSQIIKRQNKNKQIYRLELGRYKDSVAILKISYYSDYRK